MSDYLRFILRFCTKEPYRWAHFTTILKF
jgi:hypothetical protein